jgi:hypothetical protein
MGDGISNSPKSDSIDSITFTSSVQIVLIQFIYEISISKFDINIKKYYLIQVLDNDFIDLQHLV